MQEITVGLALIAGILSFISPCVLPLIPAYIGYMSGRMTHSVAVQTAGATTAGTTGNQTVTARVNLLIHSLAFILGFTSIFVVLGLITTGVISAFGGASFLLTDIISRVGGLAIILFGLHFMGILPSIFRWLRQHPPILNSIWLTLAITIVVVAILPWAFVEVLIALPVITAFLLWLFIGGAFTEPRLFWGRLMGGFERFFYTDTRKQIDANDAGGLGGSYFMGVVFAAGWTPCIGPIYGAILNTASISGDMGTAIVSLSAYSLGLGIPFMLTALLLERVQGILKRLQRHMRLIEAISGGFLIFIGVLVASGRLQSLSTTLSTGEFSDFSYRVEECSVGFIQGHLAFDHLGSCYDGQLDPIAINQGMIGELRSDTQKREYIFLIDEENISEGYAVDVELMRLENITPTVTLYGPDGSAIATGDVLIQFEENKYKIIQNAKLSAPGLYRVSIEDEIPDSTEADYQIRIVQSSGEVIGASETQADGAVSDLAAAGIGSIETLAQQSEPLTGFEIGNQAPDFTVTTIGGETVHLSDLQGQTVLLNFWGTWCGPCRREMPEFQDLYSRYSEDGFTILALAVNDTLQDVIDFKDEFGLTFTLALDTDDVVNKQYGITSQPSSLLIDADGIILYKSFGIVTEEQLEPLIREATGTSG